MEVNIDMTTYIALSLVMFLEYAVWGAWAPVLAARLLGPLKMTGKQTGWIYATLPIACIISPLVSGWLADKYINMEYILVGAHLVGAVLLAVAALQREFKPLLIVMFLYSFCYAATLPLVNAALFNANPDEVTLGKVFIWAPVAWALVGWLLTGYRMSRKAESDGKDCLFFASALSVLMAVACFTLPANAPAGTGEIPIVAAFSMLKQGNFLLFILLSMVIAGMMQFYFLGSAQFMQDKGVSSKHVPASMALAQIAQAVATWYLLSLFVDKDHLGFKWTLVVGAACWFILYVAYIIGQPRGLIIGCQPLHGLAYVFFIIAGQMCANLYATPETVSSMQALIFAATVGVGLFFGTQLAGYVMDMSSTGGGFNWKRVWMVPCAVMAVGVLLLAIIYQEPPAKKADANPDVKASTSASETQP